MRADEVVLSQQSYIESLIAKFDPRDAHTAPTPLVTNHHHELRLKEPGTEGEKEEMIQVPYHELVGFLPFVSTRTRPDTGVAVGEVARRVADPRPTTGRR